MWVDSTGADLNTGKKSKIVGSDLLGPWAGWRCSTCDDNVANVGFVSYIVAK